MRDEENVNAHIKLIDPSGNQIAADWSDGGLAEIRSIILNQTGTYYILAYDNNHNDVGEYGLSLHTLKTPEYATPISSFTSLTGNIESNCAVDMYSFAGIQGDVLYAELRGESIHFEGEFFIYNSQGQEQFHSGKNGEREVVGPVTLGQDDTYTIAVIERGGNDKSSYGFTMNLLKRHEEAPLLGCAEFKGGKLKQLVDRKVYRIESDNDLMHIIESRSNSLSIELCLEIYDVYGNKVFQQVNTNRLNHAFLQHNSSPSYLLVVFDEHGNDTGDFGIQHHTIGECSVELSCDAYDSDFETAALGSSKVFKVHGVQQQPILASLSKMNGAIDPHLRLYNMQGNLIAENKGRSQASLSDFSFPYTDDFVLIAGDLNGNEDGELSFSYEGSDFDVSLQDCYSGTHGFSAFNSVLIEVEQNQYGLTYQWSNGAQGPNINVQPTQDTDYTVTVTSNNGCTKTLTTTVEVQDVTCGNGNNIKVQVCHVKNNGTEQQKCISENGVWAHLNNGNGHENCYLGECGFEYICTNPPEIQQDQEAQALTREESDGHTINADFSRAFPNPSTGQMTIETYNQELVEGYAIYDLTGKLLVQRDLETPEVSVQLDVQQHGISPGLLMVAVSSATSRQVHKVIYLR